LALPAAAHRANVFAWEDGGTIHVETSFSGGAPALNASIKVTDAATGAALLEGTTDDKGFFVFAIPDAARQSRLDMRIVLGAGQGHQGEWIIRADEYLGAGTSSTSPLPVQAKVASAAVPGTSTLDAATLESIVETVVNRQVAPLRRSLASMAQPGPTAHDIFGGIGYILGLFGIVALMKSRKVDK